VDWQALQPQADHKRVLIVEGLNPRSVGSISEEILLVEVAGQLALRRTQLLESPELGDRSSVTVVFRDTFLPHSHFDITNAYNISVAYKGTAVAGKKQVAGGKVIAIRADLRAPVFDAHSIEMVLRLLPLTDDYVAELPVFHAARGERMMVTLQAIGREIVTDSMGSLDAWKIRTEWDGVTQYYWRGVEDQQLVRQSSRLKAGVYLEFARG